MAQTSEFGGISLDEEQPQKSMESALLDIAPGGKQPEVKSEFGGIPVDEPQQPSLLERTHATTEKLDPLTMQNLQPVAEAFGSGFKEGFGDHKLGLSEDDLKALRESKIFREADQRGLDSWRAPFQAMNEIVLNSIWDAGDLAFRTGSGLFRGGQAAVQQFLGGGRFGREVAAIPEAFFGTPHPMGVPKVGEPGPVPEVKVPEYKPFDPARPKDLPSPTPANINEPGSPFRWISDKEIPDQPMVPYDAAVSKSKELAEGDRKALEDEEKQITQSAIDSGREEFTKEERDRLDFIDRKLADAREVSPNAWRVIDSDGLASASVRAAWLADEGRYSYQAFTWMHGENYAEHESPEFGTLNAAKQWAEDHLKGRDPDVKELRKQEQPELRARAAERIRQGFQVVEGGGQPKPAVPTSTFIKDIGSGKSAVPTVADLSDALKLVRDQDRAQARAVGMTDAEYNRLVQLNRDIDKGGTTADRAIKEKNELLKRFPDESPEVDMIDEDSLKQLRTEFENLEKSDFESVADYADGIARTLKRYIGKLTDGDDLALAVFRKAFDEAQKHGLDTKALSNDIINRFLSDLSPSDQAYMRKTFQDFLRPKLEAPATGETPKPQSYVKPTEITPVKHAGTDTDIDPNERVIIEDGKPRLAKSTMEAIRSGVRYPGWQGSRVEAAQTGIPHVDAILNDPVTKNVIENPIVDRSHTVPYTAGGSVPLEDPTMYIDRRFPKEFTIEGGQAVEAFHGSDRKFDKPSTEFGSQRGGIPDEAGTVFFSSTHNLASSYGKNVTSKHIDLSNSEVFDVSQLVRDAEFLRGMRASWERTATRNDELKQRAQTKAGQETIERGWQRILDKIENPENDHGFVRYNSAITGAIIQRARAKGLDVAVVKNMAEGHGMPSDQFIVLNDRAMLDKGKSVTWDPAEPFAIHENVEQHVMEALIKGGMDKQVAYKVAHFEFAEKAEGAWYKAHGIDQAKAEAAYKPYMDKIQRGKADNVPPNLYKDPYPHDAPSAAKNEALDEPKPTKAELQQALEILKADQETAKEAPAGPKPVDLAQARELGVIGPDKPPISEGTPAEAAARVTGGGTEPPAGGGKGGGGPPGGGGPGGAEPPKNPWQERFEKFVSKLKTPDEVKQLILDAARDYPDDVLRARQGDIPLHQLETIQQVSGIEPGGIDPRGLGRLMKNDAEIGISVRAMFQAGLDVKAAAREVKINDTPENLIKFQEAILRHAMLQETLLPKAVMQVIGLRAEWGRGGLELQRYMNVVKDQETLREFLKDKKTTPENLRKLADGLEALDVKGTARLLTDARKPGFWDKFIWYWTNNLISGWATHAKYIGGNTAFAAIEAGPVTGVAGLVSGVRRAITGGTEGVYAGEVAARLWGMIAGTKDAIVAAGRAARTGLQTPLPSEIAQNIVPKRNLGIAFQQQPIGGVVGTAISLPTRGAAAIHSFYNFLGHRASIEAQAYRMARAEGLPLTDDAFWQKRQNLADNPTTEMMNDAIDEGYRLTYIKELGPVGKAIQTTINKTKIGRLILPFTHMPFNILEAGLEYNPATAFLPREVRNNLLGRNGAVKQDMAIARIIVGSATGAFVMNWLANDQFTGAGPTDPKERREWLETNHIPYAVRIGDEWFSYNRFGSLGTMLGIYANLGDAIPHMKPDQEELTKALAMTIHTTGRLLEDEVGMQGLAGLIEAIDEPERKGTRFVANFAGSMLPYSSFLRQTASSMDPYMRETKSVVDGLKYYTPFVRTGQVGAGLLPKRNWLGDPIPNVGYGGDLPVPALSSIIQHRDARADLVSEEMKRLDINPAPPQDRIGGVKLPPKLYDEFQLRAGAIARVTLENWVTQSGWEQLPPGVQANVLRNSIQNAHQAAGSIMQLRYPELIWQGLDNRIRQIQGEKPGKQLMEPLR